jgi:hypothetical protein
MLRLLTTLSLGAALLVLPLQAGAQQADPGMLRIWNGAGNGVVRVAVVHMATGGYGVHVWGACSPTPCDWGLAPLQIFGGTVSAPSGAWGNATFKNGFSVTYVVLAYQGGSLMVRTFTHFTDNSGRSSYTEQATLH